MLLRLGFRTELILAKVGDLLMTRRSREYARCDGHTICTAVAPWA